MKAFVVQRVADSGGVLKEHGGDVSTMKLPCSSIELFSLNSRVSACGGTAQLKLA